MARMHVHDSTLSSFTTSLVVVSNMSHTFSIYSANFKQLIGFIVSNICNNHIMNERIHTNIVIAHET